MQMNIWFENLQSSNGTFYVRRCEQRDDDYENTSYENLVENLKTRDEGEIYKDGFKWHPECKSLAELKASLIIETPDTLAKKYCMETFTGTGLHNIPKFFVTQTISWWLGTMMAKGIYFDFDAFKYDGVIEIFKALGKKVYETYA